MIETNLSRILKKLGAQASGTVSDQAKSIDKLLTGEDVTYVLDNGFVLSPSGSAELDAMRFDFVNISIPYISGVPTVFTSQESFTFGSTLGTIYWGPSLLGANLVAIGHQSVGIYEYFVKTLNGFTGYMHIATISSSDGTINKVLVQMVDGVLIKAGVWYCGNYVEQGSQGLYFPHKWNRVMASKFDVDGVFIENVYFICFASNTNIPTADLVIVPTQNWYNGSDYYLTAYSISSSHPMYTFGYFYNIMLYSGHLRIIHNDGPISCLINPLV